MPGFVYLRVPIAIIVAALFTGCLLAACTTAENLASVESGTVEFAVTPTVEASETSTMPPTVVTVSPSPGSSPSPLPPETSQVEIVIAKDVYEVGVAIPYTIINHSDRPIYYRFPPLVVQWVDDTEVVLITNPTDVWPPIEEIEPNGSINGSWDQTFHPYDKADPEVQNHRYQLRFVYVFTKENLNVPGEQLMARSPVFTIK